MAELGSIAGVGSLETVVVLMSDQTMALAFWCLIISEPCLYIYAKKTINDTAA